MAEGKWGTGFFTGLIVGGLIGAIAALLLAPESGEKTRQRLREKAEGLVTEGKKVVKEAIEEGKAGAAETAHELRAKLQHGKESTT